MSRQRIDKSDRELEELQDKLEYAEGELKVFIADILPKDVLIRKTMEDRMIELENLVNTYGWVVIVKHIQNKSVPDYNTFIGQGRLEEIIEEMEREGANILIFGNILKAKQIHILNEKLRTIWAKAWDRVDLILKIFEKNAHSAEAKMQIELACIKHMGPRIYGMWMELSKQGWGVGTRGKWETNTEIMKRHLRKKEQHIREDLAHFAKVREQHRQGRKRKWMTTIWIVGYTNAGKSTLTNALTKKWVLVEDKLFATLGTSVGKMFIPASYDQVTGAYIAPKEVLINDTIGFIRELPPKLIDAFKSTLEDSIESDLLLHVIDASDPKFELKVDVVEEILESIWAKQRSIYVINKMDEVSDGEFIKIYKGKKEDEVYTSKKAYIEEKYWDKELIFISATEKYNIDELKELIISSLEY
jgi:GTP-binding protein HflX